MGIHQKGLATTWPVATICMEPFQNFALGKPPFTDSSIAKKSCRKRCVLVSDRHSIAIADFGFSDRYPIALRGSTQTLAIVGILQSVLNQPTSTKDIRSDDQSSCNHDRDRNSGRAIRCTKSFACIPPEIL